MGEQWELIECNRYEAQAKAAEGWEPYAVTTGTSPFGGTITFHLRRHRSTPPLMRDVTEGRDG